MRPIFTVLLALCVFVTNTLPSHANCKVLDTIDKLHAVQMRLISNPNTPIFHSELRFLRSQSDSLDNGLVLDAVNSNALSSTGASFLRFTRHAKELLDRVSIDDPDTLRRHYANPNVRSNLQSIGSYMGEFRCSPAEIAAASMPRAEEEDRDRILREAVLDLLSLKNFSLLLLIIGTTSAAAYAYKSLLLREQRQTRRYIAQYATRYKLGDITNDGILFNINNKGAKLKQGPEGRLIIGSTVEILISDIWTPAFVSWSNMHYSGVVFKNTLSGKHVQHIRQTSGNLVKTKKKRRL